MPKAGEGEGAELRELRELLLSPEGSLPVGASSRLWWLWEKHPDADVWNEKVPEGSVWAFWLKSQERAPDTKGTDSEEGTPQDAPRATQRDGVGVEGRPPKAGEDGWELI